LPRCIGVVTSPTGAAIRDILRVLKRRFPNAQVSLFPVKVQGAGSAVEIVQALRYFNRVKTIDVLILARGGGSLEDLWTFNEEAVARAISESVIPIITGIGHETDFTIADFVSDLRAPTPSAAAEIVVRSRDEFERHIAEHARRISQQMRFHLSQWKHRVRDLQTHRGFRRLDFLLRGRRQLLDEYSNSLTIGLRLRLAMARQRVTEANAHIASFDLRGRAAVLRRHIDLQRGNLRTALDRVVTRKHRALNLAQMRFAALDLRARVAAHRHRLQQSDTELRLKFERLVKSKRKQFDAVDTQRIERDPLRILDRGYSITYDSSGKVLRSTDQVVPGDNISVRLARGELAATVRKKS
jgi:exodeoxyribonuclease VII large subunit